MEYFPNYDDYFNDYRNRYNAYWVRRFGMIPELPTSLDNSNSIYELLAWLQRAFKALLDDFINMQLEFDQFKNALTDMLERLIPELIRQYVHSDEFRKIIEDIIDDWYNRFLKPILDEINNKIDNLNNQLGDINNKLGDLENLINNLNQTQGADRDKLDKIINKLTEIGVWDKASGNFKPNMGIAGGNINLFGGALDGGYWIRTNNGKTENDLAGGIK